jgi:pimeloyl-ACP methyl ester carboxylesterase
MTIIEANEAKLWYDIQGDGEPIVCIGGMGLVSNQFDFVTPHLAKETKVINWDLRGVGKSRPIPKLNYRDYAEQADDLLAIMDHAGIEKAHIWAAACSHIGVRFAAEYPERTASLIFFPWYSPKKTISQVFDAGVELSYAFNSLEYWALVIANKFTSPQYQEKMREWEVPKLMENLDPEMFRIHWGSMKNSDRRPDLPKIKCPTLLLMGDAGVAGNETNRREVTRIKETIPGGADTHFIEGCGGTYFMIEAPEQTAEALINWTKKHPVNG